MSRKFSQGIHLDAPVYPENIPKMLSCSVQIVGITVRSYQKLLRILVGLDV